ncbi:MAG: 50S ribosomal protein L17 [Parcubacteria group bacterium]|nr:50S ribosomal protein L17 [Parcubacteria group bacterium]
MRHRKRGRKLAGKRGIKRAFIKSLAANFIIAERITTTLVRAKETRRVVEKLVTLAKKGDLTSYRELLRRLPKKAAEKLFKDIAPRLKDRRGGYTRVVRSGARRKRDSAPVAIIEFVE